LLKSQPELPIWMEREEMPLITTTYQAERLKRAAPLLFIGVVGWHWNEKTELSLVGRNLLGPRHSETENQDGILHTLVDRSIALRLTWRF
jgi:hypothetical protein